VVVDFYRLDTLLIYLFILLMTSHSHDVISFSLYVKCVRVCLEYGYFDFYLAKQRYIVALSHDMGRRIKRSSLILVMSLREDKMCC